MSVDTSGFEQRIKRVEQETRDGLQSFADEAMYLFQGFVEESFEEGSAAEGKFSGSKNLHVNSGALTRSYIPGQPGNVSAIKVEANGRLTFTVGTTLVYARIHEEGGFVRSKGKMEKFFWAMYMQTRREFYRIMALSVRKKGGVQMPARPFHAPAVKAMQTDGKRILLQRLSRLLAMAFAQSSTQPR